MKNFKIVHFDDREGPRINVSAQIKSLNRIFRDRGINVEIKYQHNSDHISICDEIMKGDKYDLLILDIYNDDTGEQVGIQILNAISGEEDKIPTLIFTQGSVLGHIADFEKLYEKYDFILGEKITKDNIDELIRRIETFILSNHNSEDLFIIDSDDMFLQADIIAIGKNNLNEILYKLKSDISYKDKFTVTRMASGYSGAALFKIKYSNKTSIIKISRDQQTLKKEYDNAIRLYKYFPSKFRIDIENKEYSNTEVYAIMIEMIGDGIPLFTWLQNNNDKVNIEKLLDELFLRYGLKSHYEKHKGTRNAKFVSIFNIFDYQRYGFVQNSIKELNPIIEHYPHIKIDINAIKNLVLNGSYENIDKNKLLDDKYIKETVLCHGDLHSNNILVQGNSPILIDTGGIDYKYWCTDLCRLIVDLFIRGFDENTYKYFDVNEISNYMITANKIIKQENIDSDKVNDGFIYAINWLTSNIDKIYGKLFTKWEYQLGLMKEFLQISYRTSSVPPSKRALALMAAYQCMVLANYEIEKY